MSEFIQTPGELKIMSYNILDIELESNFVPRNMHKSSKDAILNAAADAIAKLAEEIAKKKNDPADDAYAKLAEEIAAGKTTVADEYWKITFAEPYKPFHSGDEDQKNKSETRQIWSDKNEKTVSINRKDRKNLMAILNEQFPPDKATELYGEIAKINYPWAENRLERVFQKIIEKDPHIVCLQEYGNGKNLQQIGGTSFANDNNSAIDAFAEKNVINKSLIQKLMYKGYDYKLYSYNPVKKNGDDGLAIFYKGDIFENDPIKTYVDMDANNQSQYTVAKYGKDNAYTTQRGCALLGLKLLNGPRVFIYTTHIQTSSNEKKNRGSLYAIRKGELDYIKNHIQTANYQPEDIVVFCGDFNLDLNNTNDKGIIDEFDILRRQKFRSEDDLGLVTSYPNGRQEYIDYIFSNRQGTLSGDYKLLSDLNGETIPNAIDQPSDHIPILLTIPLGATQETAGGKTRKRRKPKKSKKSKPKKSNQSKKKKRKYY